MKLPCIAHMFIFRTDVKFHDPSRLVHDLNFGTLFSPPFSQDKDKGSSNKTPKLDRSDGVKEMKEKASKRKLPFTVGANGDQNNSDSGKEAGPDLSPEDCGYCVLVVGGLCAGVRGVVCSALHSDGPWKSL